MRMVNDELKLLGAKLHIFYILEMLLICFLTQKKVALVFIFGGYVQFILEYVHTTIRFCLRVVFE